MSGKLPHMRTRHQTGTLRAAGKGRWELVYRNAEGKQTTHTIDAKTKSAAQVAAAEFLAPINQEKRDRKRGGDMSLGAYAEHVYIPHAEGKWKGSTAGTAKSRIREHIVRSEIGKIAVAKVTRTDMQDALNRLALQSRSSVSHVRFDLRAILRLAVADGYAPRNQAEALFTPPACSLPAQPVMNPDQVQTALAALDLRERVFCRIAIYAGMRPGEICGLKWSDIQDATALVDDRWYKGVRDTTKTNKARTVALSPAVVRDLEIWRAWRTTSEFVFGSENPEKPVWYANLWAREIKPRFKKLGLEWADFRCMRRTNSTLMKAAGADVKVSADQRGHGVNVALAEYTHSTQKQKAEAVKLLEESIN